MITTVDIGLNVYPVCISTNVVGGNPGGDRLYILAKRFEKRMRTQHPVRATLYGSSYRFNLGKRVQGGSLSGVLVSSDINGALAILDKNIIAFQTDAAIDVYLWVKCPTTGAYLQWATKTVTAKYSNYLKIVIDNYTVSYQEGSKLYEVSISFTENWGLA